MKKKILALTLVTTMLLSVAACGTKEPSTGVINTTTEKSADTDNKTENITNNVTGESETVVGDEDTTDNNSDNNTENSAGENTTTVNGETSTSNNSSENTVSSTKNPAGTDDKNTAITTEKSEQSTAKKEQETTTKKKTESATTVKVDENGKKLYPVVGTYKLDRSTTKTLYIHTNVKAELKDLTNEQKFVWWAERLSPNSKKYDEELYELIFLIDKGHEFHNYYTSIRTDYENWAMNYYPKNVYWKIRDYYTEQTVDSYKEFTLGYHYLQIPNSEGGTPVSFGFGFSTSTDIKTYRENSLENRYALYGYNYQTAYPGYCTMSLNTYGGDCSAADIFKGPTWMARSENIIVEDGKVMLTDDSIWYSEEFMMKFINNEELSSTEYVMAYKKLIKAHYAGTDKEFSWEKEKTYEDYVEGKSYYTGDIVRYNGKLYICTVLEGTPCPWNPTNDAIWGTGCWKEYTE